jgi:chitinase
LLCIDVEPELMSVYRNLKVVLSVGGWTYSQSGHFNFVTDAGKRATFVNSAVQVIKDYGFDGM